jgi:transcriptional regulator with XRE-family HTH domain
MTDSTQLIETLKRVLRSQGITYAEAARRLGLSEASVKRLFSVRRFTLARLDEFCRVLDIDLFELARLARGRDEEVREMTDAQEKALAGDAVLLGVFYLLLSDWTAADILAGYELSPPDLTRSLVKLDRLGLVDLLPGDRVRLRVPKLLRLHPGGPIHRAHGARVLGDFIAAEFDRAGGYFRFEYRELSKASYELMQRRLAHLAAEFLELAELDATLPSRQRASTGMLLATRHWELARVTGLKPRASPFTPAPAARAQRHRPARARARS